MNLEPSLLLAQPAPELAPPIAKRLSCGVVLVNDQAELLLCHVTGQEHWDLPKGGAADDEAPLQAALRETREETGLVLDAAGLLDLGRIVYRTRKDLHLFAGRVARFDAALLWCQSRFDDNASGQRMPEMDGYGWFAFAEVPVHCNRKLSAVLRERLDLAAVLTELRQRELMVPQFTPEPAAEITPSIWPAPGLLLA